MRYAMTSQQTETRFDEFCRQRELLAAMTDDQLRVQIENAYHEYTGRQKVNSQTSDRQLTLLYEACEASDRQALWDATLANYKARRKVITNIHTNPEREP